MTLLDYLSDFKLCGRLAAIFNANNYIDFSSQVVMDLEKLRSAVRVLQTVFATVLQESHAYKPRDFKEGLQMLRDYAVDASQKELRRALDRADDVASRICQQEFDACRCEHDMECLLKLASLMGLHEFRAIASELTGTAAASEGWEKLKAEGNEHYKSGRWAEAMDCYTKAIRVNAKVPVLYSNRALCEMQLAKFDLAREDAEDAIDLDPKQVKFYRILSDALFRLELFQEALSACEDGLKLDPSDEILVSSARDCEAAKTTRASVADMRNLDLSSGDVNEELMDAWKAAEHLRAAADQGHPGALMSLQQLLRSGAHGANAMDESKKIVKEMADLNEKEALFLIGMNYLVGEGGFKKDFTQAEKYLRKAADLDHIQAAHELANILLQQEKHVEGVRYLRKAAQSGYRKSQRALGFLLAVGHCCERDETQARAWLLRSRLSKSFVENVILQSACLVQFEAVNGLSHSGQTYSERFERLAASKFPNGPKKETLEAMFRLFKETQEKPPHPACGPVSDMGKKMFRMALRAAQGSRTAQQFLVALDILKQASLALEATDASEAFRLYRLADRILQPLPLDFAFMRKLAAAAKEVFEKNPRDADALFVIVHFSIATKSCSLPEMLRMALNCAILNPDVAEFQFLLGNLYGFNNEFALALKSIERALKLEFEPQWLYSRASALRHQSLSSGGKESLVVIKAFQEYISANEPDHRHVPEALYCIAEEYMGMKDFASAREYFDKGLQAESPHVRLPFYEPLDNFPSKVLLKIALGRVAAASQSGQGRCANCDKSGASSRCSKCKKAFYCNRDCQLNHWKVHKKQCAV